MRFTGPLVRNAMARVKKDGSSARKYDSATSRNVIYLKRIMAQVLLQYVQWATCHHALIVAEQV